MAMLTTIAAQWICDMGASQVKWVVDGPAGGHRCLPTCRVPLDRALQESGGATPILCPVFAELNMQLFPGNFGSSFQDDYQCIQLL